ncbi:hypothetical protein [Pseudazoarcus pumilus]|uniref:PilZ domain-containing protein n=1 Tax=Pseudazoarcus pumilus TaxID=2067960 RepID=A0A2I6SA99_9RHOO|nr:hypothetical protein [Pseudazoarcus pumilus]AUN96183.1 hypothetical protein C0099_15290 [Pseudazoarcus pumilus]
MSKPTPDECLAALRALHGRGGQDVHGELRSLIDVVGQCTPPSAGWLDVLEALREPLEHAQSALSHQYAERPAAPGEDADLALHEVSETWLELAQAYALLARDTAIGPSASTHALLAQRRVHYCAAALIEFIQARRAVPAGMWGALNAAFADAEARGFAWTRAPDALNRAWQAQSAAEAHAEALLIDLSNPFAFDAGQLVTVRELARYFAPYCRLLPEGSDAEDGRRTAYALDLGSDRGLRPLDTLDAGAPLRRFDSSQLVERFREVATRLRKSGQAGDLGLSAAITAEDVVQLLLSLYKPWARGATGRRFARRPGRGTAELNGDWNSIAFFITGKPFEQPTMNTIERSIRADERMLTLGERVTDIMIDDRPDRQRVAARHGHICTQWEMLDQSLGGFRLRRRGSTERLEHRGLVAIRPNDAKSFMLGVVGWVMYREDGALDAGVKLMNGLPRVVAIRSVGIGRERSDIEFQMAFLLEATPALKSPATLVIPAGYFLPHRVVEVHDGRLRGYRLLEIVERGANFDQVTFEAVKVVA